MNITPDSFYERSRFPDLSSALSHAQTLHREGADLLDLGGESTRPGAAPVSLEEEKARLLPLIEALVTQCPNLPLSIDTQKADVARAALERGAVMINDISAMRHDPEMARVMASASADVVLMHMQGTPQTMQQAPVYRDVVDEIKAFFVERLDAARRAGIAENRVILDPGVGFGKTLEHNVTILRRLRELTVIGRPLLIGVSRKSMIGRLGSTTDILPPEQRLEGSLAAALWSVSQGASGVRVHDVAATRRALEVWERMTA